MKSITILFLFAALAFSLKYSPSNLNHLQPTQKPLTVSAPIASTNDKPVGEKVKEAVKNDTLPTNTQNQTTKVDQKPIKPEDKSQPINKTEKLPEQAKPQQNVTKPQEKSKTQDKVTKPQEKVTKPEQKPVKPQQKASKPQDKVTKPQEKDNKPEEKSTKPQEKVTKPETITKPENKETKSDNSTITKVTDSKSEQKNDDPTTKLFNCNQKGRCWKWCGDQQKLSENKDSFHKATDGKWCYTTAQNSCKKADDCKTYTKCVDNCSARWGQ